LYKYEEEILPIIISILYILGILFIFNLAWLPIPMIIDHILYEDFYYYLKVAQNISIGAGVTLDGEAITNGFHPLWMIVCIIAQTISTPLNAVYIVLSFASLLHIGQVYLVFKILKLTCKKEIAHFTALFYLFNYRIIACNLCGLETPIAAFLILIVIYFIIKHIQLNQIFDIGSSIKLGILLGLSVLGRFDLLLFVGAVISLIILDSNFGSNFKKRFFMVSTISISIFILLLPWFIWSILNSGTLLPNSHTALKVIAFKSFSLESSLVENIYLLIRKVFSTAWWLTDTANLLGLWPIVFPYNYITISTILIFLLLTIVIYITWFTRTKKRILFRSILIIYAIGHLTYYSLFAKAEVRYLMPFNIVIIIFTAIAINDLILRFYVNLVRKAAIFFYFILFANSMVAGVLAWQQHQGSTRSHVLHKDLYKMSQWISTNTNKKATIGSWNAGIMSYYSERTVVNLDGVINDEVIEINKQRKLSLYIEKRNINFLVDLSSTVEKFMNKFSGNAKWHENYTKFHQIGHVVILQRKELSN
jgi:hypothetical protein